MRESALALLLAWILAAQQGLCGKLEKIAQQPSNVLEDYYAYRHISIVHFNVPERSVVVVFKYVSDPDGWIIVRTRISRRIRNAYQKLL